MNLLPASHTPSSGLQAPGTQQAHTQVRHPLPIVMEAAALNETEHGLGIEPQPFSIVLAPPATVCVQRQRRHDYGVLVRYLCARKPHQHQQIRDRAGRISKKPSSSLSSIVVVVRAQPHALHLYRGRTLCRVVEFPSAVADVAGLPRGSSAEASAETICVAVCRDGTAYALPAAEVLEGEERGGGVTMDHNRSGKSKHKPTAAGPSGGGGRSGGDAALGAAPSGASEQKPGSRSSSSSAAVGIFDELAPTILDDSQESLSQELAATQLHEDGSATGSGNGSGGGSGGLSLGGLVMQAQERWAVFTHSGARTVAVCSDGTITAVAGIIDPASSYGIAVETNNGGGVYGTSTAAGRRLGTLAGVDGAAPTTSCMVWVEDGSCGGSALGDGKGFPLPSPVFHSLFGGGLLARSSQAVPDSAAAQCDVAGSKPAFPATASVVLIGDTAGTVRWSPVPPLAGFSGGVLASLPGETTAIVAVLPQLDAESRAVGVLLIGANGAVMGLAAAAAAPALAASAASSGNRVSRKRSRPDDAGEHDRRGGVGSGCDTTDRGASPPPPSPHPISRRLLGLPFPVASACSVPGFLVHCHAGALFATAVPAAGGGEQDTRLPPAAALDRSTRPGSNHAAAPVLPLRPVRLPLPCDTVGVAVAPVLASEDEKPRTTAPNLSAAGGASSAVRRTLVMSLSGQGRLVGFMAPQSAEELEGWRLDTGRGGVRVGGSAGVERRVRGQLERLSSLGRQCAALSAESAERDREIGVLRGATVLLPPLVAMAARRVGADGGGVPASSESLAHSISMAPDTQEAASGFADSYGGGQGPGQSDALQVG